MLHNLLLLAILSLPINIEWMVYLASYLVSPIYEWSHPLLLNANCNYVARGIMKIDGDHVRLDTIWPLLTPNYACMCVTFINNHVGMFIVPIHSFASLDTTQLKTHLKLCISERMKSRSSRNKRGREMKLVHVPLLRVPPRISLHVSFNIVNPKALWPSGIVVICPFSETYIPLVVSSSLIGCYWQKHLSTMHKITCHRLRYKNPL